MQNETINNPLNVYSADGLRGEGIVYDGVIMNFAGQCP